jgi:hypothetical protein
MRERHERAVSEVISFVLVFALIALTVGVVYATGFGGLTDSREAERVNNAERAFDVLADNIEDITQRGAPSRATEIKLADANIGLSKTEANAADESEVVVSVEITNWDPDDDDTAEPAFAGRVSSDPIVYTANRPAEIVYANGAVMRSDRGDATMVREPNVVFRGDSTRTAVVPLIETRAVGSTGVGGDTTVLIRTVERASNVNASTNPSTDTTGGTPDEYEVDLTVQSTEARAPVWRDYYESQFPDSWSPTCSVTDINSDGLQDDVVCSFAVDRLFVPTYAIDVSFA